VGFGNDYSPANKRTSMYVVEPRKRTTKEQKSSVLAMMWARSFYLHASPATEKRMNAMYPVTAALPVPLVAVLSFRKC